MPREYYNVVGYVPVILTTQKRKTMTAKEYLESKDVEFENGYFVTEVYPSKIYKWMEEYHQAKLKLLDIAPVVGSEAELPNMTLEQAIDKAKPNLDKIQDIDKHLDNIW